MVYIPGRGSLKPFRVSSVAQSVLWGDILSPIFGRDAFALITLRVEAVWRAWGTQVRANLLGPQSTSPPTTTMLRRLISTMWLTKLLPLLTPSSFQPNRPLSKDCPFASRIREELDHLPQISKSPKGKMDRLRAKHCPAKGSTWRGVLLLELRHVFSKFGTNLTA